MVTSPVVSPHAHRNEGSGIAVKVEARGRRATDIIGY